MLGFLTERVETTLVLELAGDVGGKPFCLPTKLQVPRADVSHVSSV